MSKQLQLFDTPASLAFDQLEERLQPILPILWKCVSDAFRSVAERIERKEEDFLAMDAGQLAQFLHPQIARRLRAEFPYGNEHEVRLMRKHRILMANYRDEVVIRIKKLRPNFSISNIPTSHNEEFWRQNIEQGGIRRVVFGYKAFSQFTQMRTFVTMPLPGMAPRYFEVEDQSARLVAIRAEELERQIAADSIRTKRSKSRVKPKKDASDKTGGTNASS